MCKGTEMKYSVKKAYSNILRKLIINFTMKFFDANDAICESAIALLAIQLTRCKIAIITTSTAIKVCSQFCCLAEEKFDLGIGMLYGEVEVIFKLRR